MLQLIHSIDSSPAKFYKLWRYHNNIFFSTDFWNQMAHLLRSRTTDNLSIVYWAYIYSSSKAIVFSYLLSLGP